VRIRVDDVELYVRDTGGDGRPLVLLHGGPGSDGSFLWPAFESLAGEYRLVAPDLRANGRSDPGDPERWTAPQMADDVQALIGALRLERVVVLGWSFGSFVAQGHMARHGSADAYVLVATVAEPGALAFAMTQLARFEPEYLRAQVAASFARQASVERAEECGQLLADQIPFHVAEPEGPVVSRLQELARGVVSDPRVLRRVASGDSFGFPDYREQLRDFAKPVLVLSGELDRTTDPRSAHELAELLPRAEELLVPRAAHMLLYEQPEQALAAIGRFLSRV
jgi:proline iminopeptidase